jgi:hypothetical protein
VIILIAAISLIMAFYEGEIVDFALVNSAESGYFWVSMLVGCVVVLAVTVLSMYMTARNESPKDTDPLIGETVSPFDLSSSEPMRSLRSPSRLPTSVAGQSANGGFYSNGN